MGPSVAAAQGFFFSRPEWVNKGASGSPIITGRHSAKSGMCIPRDHTATHSKGSLNDSLIAQEKDGGDGTGKNIDGEERERKRVTSKPHFIAPGFIELHRCCIFFFFMKN